MGVPWDYLGVQSHNIFVGLSIDQNRLTNDISERFLPPLSTTIIEPMMGPLTNDWGIGDIL